MPLASYSLGNQWQLLARAQASFRVLSFPLFEFLALKSVKLASVFSCRVCEHISVASVPIKFTRARDQASILTLVCFWHALLANTCKVDHILSASGEFLWNVFLPLQFANRPCCSETLWMEAFFVEGADFLSAFAISKLATVVSLEDVGLLVWDAD